MLEAEARPTTLRRPLCELEGRAGLQVLQQPTALVPERSVEVEHCPLWKGPRALRRGGVVVVPSSIAIDGGDPARLHLLGAHPALLVIGTERAVCAPGPLPQPVGGSHPEDVDRPRLEAHRHEHALLPSITLLELTAELLHFNDVLSNRESVLVVGWRPLYHYRRNRDLGGRRGWRGSWDRRASPEHRRRGAKVASCNPPHPHRVGSVWVKVRYDPLTLAGVVHCDAPLEGLVRAVGVVLIAIVAPLVPLLGLFEVVNTL
mmetsp:Transcript_77100/g.221507  ORF Transcript_77100/g.221507 Transcript_77100/m.221507 type:complete len:260 (+) Transcript_77100:340-1119(+)